MTSLPEQIVHLWRSATLVLLLTLLASCGPGTGGTGTGPIGFSGNLAAGSAAVAAIAAPGLPCRSCTRVELRLDDGQVELRVPCGRFVFAGQFSPDATELALPGTLELAGASGTASSPATLRLQFGSEGSRSEQVVITLVDAAGVPLVAATLQRAEGPPAPEACTP